mmetsp:Transcript_25098/g.41812  ORF Transcript_25098/g.41812 Transcript_25098/m.41812 type:complete len:343 (-) Transcript_25098:1997-3025(-)
MGLDAFVICLLLTFAMSKSLIGIVHRRAVICSRLTPAAILSPRCHHTLKMSMASIGVQSVSIGGGEMTYLDTGTINDYAPVVILPGTAQTIDTFTPHINQIAKSRRLLIPELRGQGTRTSLDSAHATMEQHVEDLAQLCTALNLESIDLAGFSFGGRVALAMAAHHPTRVNKLSITAVPLQRTVFGRVVLDSWIDGLSANNIRECAWSFLINGYSVDFVVQNADRLPMYVDMVVDNNDPKRVYDLIRLSHDEDPNSVYSVPQCARRVRCPVQVIGATEDRIAGVDQVRQLADCINSSASATKTTNGASNNVAIQYHEMNTGHLAPFENPLTWRKCVMEFFSP